MSAELSNNEIVRMIVREIRNDKDDYFKKKNKYKKRFPKFFETMPRLFEASLSPDFDLRYLDYMMNMSDKVENQSMNTLEAYKKVYETLRKDYIDPIVPPDPEMLDKAEKNMYKNADNMDHINLGTTSANENVKIVQENKEKDE